jgi:hypothetical protein
MLYKALIRSITTNACPTWKYAVEDHFFILQRLQNRVLRAIGNLDRGTPVREFHVAFKIPYVYDYRGCFKKSFTTLKAYINLHRGHTQRFELS